MQPALDPARTGDNVRDKPLRDWRLTMPEPQPVGRVQIRRPGCGRTRHAISRAPRYPSDGRAPSRPPRPDSTPACEIAPSPDSISVGLGRSFVANPATLSYREHRPPLILIVLPRRPGDRRRRGLDYGEAQSFQNLPLRRSLRLIGDKLHAGFTGSSDISV